MKLSNQISGITGEYFVAAELSRRGLIAAITLKNTESVDIIATNKETFNQVFIQVKTTQNKRSWPLFKKVENNYSDYLFYNLCKYPKRSNG